MQNTRAVVCAAAGIAACPIIWNIVARNEYRRHTIEKLLGGKVRGCYLLAAWIFFSSLYRDRLYDVAVRSNATSTIVSAANKEAVALLKGIGATLFAGGMTLVLSAYYRLGITGTYLGDYFGILMKERVTAFPFSHFDNPMYLGSTLSFVSMALWSNSLVGVGLSAWVHGVYWVSTNYYEGPFTTQIYQNAAAEKAAATK